MAGSDQLEETVWIWADGLGIDPARLPSPEALRRGFGGSEDPLRPPARATALASWERRYGYALPRGLRAWLLLSDGFHPEVALIHPLSAIGPMVPFARVPDLLIQPESWFELGNPEAETVCIDLAYRWPGGDFPVFASGDDQRGTAPRVIAAGFDDWFLRLLAEGGRAFWSDPAFEPLGDPWREHRRWTPAPVLPPRLRTVAGRVGGLLGPGADEGAIASSLGLSRLDVELIARSLQHTPPPELARPR